MLNNIFKRNKDTSFQYFIDKIKTGERNFLKILGISENKFTDAPFEELLSNHDDVLSKVNRVQKNFTSFVFGIFDSILIKHDDDGNTKYVFYTIPKNTAKIFEVSETIFKEFGNGFYKSDEFYYFKNKDRVENLSNDNDRNDYRDIVTIWHYKDLSILLQFKKVPEKQFSLMITKNSPKAIDPSIRRKGTILDILNFNPKYSISNEAVNIRKEMKLDKVLYTEVTCKLSEKVMGIFNTATCLLFGDQDFFDKKTASNIFFKSEKKLTSIEKIIAIEQLIKIYSVDLSGAGELELYEIEKLEENVFWTGRRWTFNEDHSLRVTANQHQKIAYEVSINNIDVEEGLQLDIMNYSELVSLFGID